MDKIVLELSRRMK